MDEKDYVMDFGFPVGALPVRVQNVPFLLVFTDRGVIPLSYVSWKGFLPSGVLLDMKELVKVAKGGTQAIQEFLRRFRSVKEFIPYSDILEVRMRKGMFNRTLIVVRRRDGRELVFRMIAGRGMGVSREEFIAMFKEIAKSVPVGMFVDEGVE